MTNQEYLAERIQKLSAEEVYDLLYDIFINIGSRYNSSRTGISQWLTEESKEYNDGRHGHWIDRGSLSCRCSECGCKSTYEFAFCPNCGAKMDEVEE